MNKPLQKDMDARQSRNVKEAVNTIFLPLLGNAGLIIDQRHWNDPDARYQCRTNTVDTVKTAGPIFFQALRHCGDI
jgi:hypothetical protein